MKKMSRALTLVLALALCFTCMTVPAFAEDEPEGNEHPWDGYPAAVIFPDGTWEGFELAGDKCICGSHWCGKNLNTDCPYCSQVGTLGNHPECFAYVECVCEVYCGGTNQDCQLCYDRGFSCDAMGPEGECVCTTNGCHTSRCRLCQDHEWKMANCPYVLMSIARKQGTYSSGKVFTPDVSGHYRTSLTKIMATVDPVAVAQQELVIDPVTNTVGNLYDSEGNLIPCTLSSDGHFYIVPVNEGYAYIPTGR